MTSVADKYSSLMFCEWLKLRRKALDLTQDELAKRAACSIGALRKIESGDRRPSKQLAALIAQALEIPIEDQPTFIRIARGELNPERLQRPVFESPTPLPDLRTLRQLQPSVMPGAVPQEPAPSARLPLEATPLIGRENELAAMARLFDDPQCRLLTLTGVGGIGKTRVAIEFASCAPPAFPGGVYYVPLSSINSPEEIAPAVGDVLNFGFSGPTEPKEQLFSYLSSHIVERALFVFDNLEHLLVRAPAQDDKSGVAELVTDILRRLPNVCILATSRERLNLHGEWTYELHGLSVPPTDYAGPVEDYKSIELFMNSARRVKADFQAAPDEQASIVQICRLVEGVPLAIELGAAWVGVLSCREIAQEIQSNMDFLSTSMRDIPERHRSIRATFDHSWNLLTEDESMALCQLSVFQGGFDRAAAYQIAGASLPLLASLCAKSLVRRNESGCYSLHQVIRQYALSHLNEHPHSLETYERHCAYYLRLVGTYERPLKSILQQDSMRSLTDEIDDIRAAWTWAIDHKKFDQIGGAGRALGWYFEIAGLLQEGIEQFERLVDVLKAEPQDNPWRRVLGLALVHQGLLYLRKGDFDSAQVLYEEGISVLRPVGDQNLLADALIYLSIILHMNGDFPRAKSLLEEGIVLARAVDDRWLEALALTSLGFIASHMGCYAEGYEQMMAGIAIWRTIGDPHSIAMGLNFVVPTLTKLGKIEEARAFMRESIHLCEVSKNRWGMGTAYSFLGLVCIAGGEYEAAQSNLLKSLDIFSEYISGWNIARSLTYLGDAAIMAGDYPEARKYYLDGLSSSIESKAIPVALDALSGLGYLQEGAGEAENALLLCYYVLNHPSSEDETKARADQLRSALEPKLTSPQVMGARKLAAELTFDEIVKIALKST